MTEISGLDFLKLVHVLLTWQIVLKAIKVQFNVCKHVLRYSRSEKDRPRSGRPQITTPREVRFMVTSSRRSTSWPLRNLLNVSDMQQGDLCYVFTARKRVGPLD